MATFTITPAGSVLTTGAADPAFDSDTGASDKLVVQDGAFLIATGAGSAAAVLAPTGLWNATIKGTVTSQQDAGIDLQAGNTGISFIDIFDDAAVSGTTAIQIGADTAVDVLNSGTVFGTDIGISTDGTARRIITNLSAGFIGGTNFAMQDIGGTSQDEINNKGTIEGDVDLSGGNDKIVNSGQITGDVLLGDDTNSLSNFGTIDGNITGGADNDSITNISTINGDVDLGDGTNKIVNKGTVDGNVTGGAGADLVDNWGNITGTVDMGAGNDTFLGNFRTDTVADSDGADSIKLYSGNDKYIATGAAADGNDSIDGGANTDTYDASAAGANVLINLDSVSHDRAPYAPVGTDKVAANTATGADVAGAGTDRVFSIENVEGGTGDDVVYGSSSVNVLNGNDGADFLAGFGGNDKLDGGAGTDSLVGGAGRDTLTGGADADSFLYSVRSESGANKATCDVIADFEDNVDTIDLTQIDANTTAAGNDAFTFIGTNVVFSNTAGELRVLWSAGSQIIEGDANGDGRADFSIEVTDPTHAIVFDAGTDILL